MQFQSKLESVLLGAGIIGLIAALSLAVGLSLLLGQLPARRIGLRLVWISGAALTAAAITGVLVLAAQ